MNRIFMALVVVAGSLSGCTSQSTIGHGDFSELHHGDLVEYGSGESKIMFSTGKFWSGTLPTGKLGDCLWINVKTYDTQVPREIRYCIDGNLNTVIQDSKLTGLWYPTYWGQPLLEQKILLSLWPAGQTIAAGETESKFFGAPMRVQIAPTNVGWRINYEILYFDLAKNLQATESFTAQYSLGNPWPTSISPNNFAPNVSRTSFILGTEGAAKPSTADWSPLIATLVPLEGALPRGSNCAEKWIDADTIIRIAAKSPDLQKPLQYGIVTYVEAANWQNGGGAGTIKTRYSEINIFYEGEIWKFLLRQTSDVFGEKEPIIEWTEHAKTSKIYLRPPATLDWCSVVMRIGSQGTNVLQITQASQPQDSFYSTQFTLIPGLAWGNPDWIVARPGGGKGLGLSVTTGSAIGRPT